MADLNSGPVCIPSGDTAHIIFNAILHMTILYIVISLIFRLVASKIISDNFKKYLLQTVDNAKTSNLGKLNKDDLTTLKMAGKYLPMDRLIKYYEQPDSGYEEHNKWLFRMNIIVMCFLVSLVIAVGAITKSLNAKLPVVPFIIVNIVTFIFVGIAEIWFFKNVAMNYVPIPPSLIVKSVLRSLRKHLNS